MKCAECGAETSYRRLCLECATKLADQVLVIASKRLAEQLRKVAEAVETLGVDPKNGAAAKVIEESFHHPTGALCFGHLIARELLARARE